MERRLIDAGRGAVAVCHHAPAVEIPGLPLLIALHGGTYTSEYFSVAGGPSGSFLDIAGRNGFAVLAVDRPGYGMSTLLPEEENTFAHQAEILDGVIAEALDVAGAGRRAGRTFDRGHDRPGDRGAAPSLAAGRRGHQR